MNARGSNRSDFWMPDSAISERIRIASAIKFGYLGAIPDEILRTALGDDDQWFPSDFSWKHFTGESKRRRRGKACKSQ